MDEAQFDALYEAQWASLVGQVTMVCGDRAEAADCVQEAFVRAWEQRRSLDADAGGWVRTAALRVAVSRWRRTRNALAAWAREDSRRGAPEVWLRPGHEHDAPVWRALARLPVGQREALVLHHVLDLTVAQAADVLGVPVGTVKARLSRGRTALAAAMDVPVAATAPGHRPEGPSGLPTSTRGAR